MDLWGRKLGMPYNEYSVMPIGELHDMIAGYQILNGMADETQDEKYIPCLR